MIGSAVAHSGGGLSKSDFVRGLKAPCHLGWGVHEPHFPVSQLGAERQDRFEPGNVVGSLATESLPAGVLMDVSYAPVQEKFDGTGQALADGPPGGAEETVR